MCCSTQRIQFSCTDNLNHFSHKDSNNSPDRKINLPHAWITCLFFSTGSCTAIISKLLMANLVQLAHTHTHTQKIAQESSPNMSCTKSLVKNNVVVVVFYMARLCFLFVFYSVNWICADAPWLFVGNMAFYVTVTLTFLCQCVLMFLIFFLFTLWCFFRRNSLVFLPQFSGSKETLWCFFTSGK